MDLQLLRLRKAAGYENRESFAEAYGIPLGTYIGWESGHRVPPIDKLWMLADIFGVSLDELVGRTPLCPPAADTQTAALVDTFADLSPEGRDTALTVVRGVLASEAARGSAPSVPASVSTS